MGALQIITESSPWFILLGLLIAAAISLLLYFQSGGLLSRQVKIALGIIRFLVVFVIFILLVGPLVKTVQNSYINPTWVIAVDNSASIKANLDSSRLELLRQKIAATKAELQTDNRNIDLRFVEEDDSLQFKARQSDLYQLLSQVGEDYFNTNLAGVVLISDGIYNNGASPLYHEYSFPVYTVGVGDTIPKKDIILQSLRFNKTAFQGNQFKILAGIRSEGFREAKKVVIEIRHDGKAIRSRTVELPASPGFVEEEFQIEAKEKGLQQYRIQVVPVSEEFTESNNYRNAYIDVVEGKNLILFAAAAPHPDINAIRTALERNENNQVNLFIPGLFDLQQEKYDLLILHQLTGKEGQFSEVRSLPGYAELPIWRIWGTRVPISGFAAASPSFQYAGSNSQFDQVTGYLNPNFQNFTLPEKLTDILPLLPPLEVPFGRYSLDPQSSVILNQRVGRVATERPLWWIYRNGSKKEAVLVGEGAWRWPIVEYGQTGDRKSFENLVQKTAQFLSAREDKRKFRVYPIDQNRLDQRVILENEIYNDVYERIYDKNISLEVTGETETYNYEYVVREGSKTYTLTNLPEGIYTYTASTELNEERLTDQGQFKVEKRNIESLDLQANFDLLRQLSRTSGGKFYRLDEFDDLESTIKDLEVTRKIFSSEQYVAALEIPWILILIIFLITIEWAIRRYQGAY